MGPISTGLGEIYMWAVEYAEPGDAAPVRDGEPGWQSDGTYLTPEGERLTDDFQRTVYLRTVQDWIIRPQMKTVPGVAGVDAIGGYVKQYPCPARSGAAGRLRAVVRRSSRRSRPTMSAAAPATSSSNGEGYVVRASGRVENAGRDRARSSSPPAAACRSASRMSPRSRSARELRTGSASENGQEVVLGTALMLIGGNSRTVAAAADAKIKEISRTLPPGIQARTVLNRTQLVDATIDTVATNLAEGALLVIVVLFLLLGNFRAALITACVIPLTMLITATGMVQGRISANLMSLGALDFGLIVDGAVIIAENCLRRLAERQRELGRALTLDERLDTVTASRQGDDPADRLRPAIIILVYVPLLTFTGVEGKMFEPMALTVIIALVAAFVLSLTFVPAMIAIAVTGGCRKQENRHRPRAEGCSIEPPLARGDSSPLPVIAAAALLFVGAAACCSPGSARSSCRPSTRRTSSWRSCASRAPRWRSRRRCSSTSRTWSASFRRSPSCSPRPARRISRPIRCRRTSSDTFIILKPQSEWPDPDHVQGRPDRADRSRGERSCPGNKLEFSQPIQMRFNELIAGVREDLAVKVFGDDFAPMLRAAGPDRRRAARASRRAERQGRAGHRPAVPGDQDRQGRDRAPRPEPLATCRT